MTNLLQLPNELKMAIIDELIAADKTPIGLFRHSLLESLAALSRSCRWFHQYVNPILYDGTVKRHPYLLIWATETQNIDCMKRLLEAGANPNMALCCWSLGEFPTKRRDDYESMIEFFRARYLRHILFPDECCAEQAGVTEDAGFCSVHRRSLDPSLWMTLWSPETVDNFAYAQHLPINLAAAAGNVDAFDLLVRYGADINAPSFCRELCHSSNASLHFVDRLQARRAIRASYNAEKNQPGMYIWTTLHIALCHGHDNLAKHIVSLGGPIREHLMTKLETQEGPTPLFIAAVKHGRLEVADYILSTGLESVYAEYGRRRYGTLLWQAYWQGSEVFTAALPILLKHGADVDADVGQGHTLLVEACSTAYYGEAHMLLDAGANDNVRLVKTSPHSIMGPNQDGRDLVRCRRASWGYPCFLCLGGCRSTSASSLLGMRPIDICIQSFFWYSTSLSLMHSRDRIIRDNASIVQHLLLSLGPRAVTDSTLLSIAVSTHQSNLVTILLNTGMDVNVQDASGRSALKNALGLLTWGVDLSHLPATLLSLAKHAQQNGIKLIDYEWAILRLLGEETASPCILEAIKTLRSCGDINSRDKDQNTVLMMAFAQGKFDVFNSLIDMGARLGRARRRQSLPDDDLEFLWELLLNGESSYDAWRALRNNAIDPERRLLQDPHFKDTATRAGRKDVLKWIHWSNLSRMRWEKHADGRKKKRG